MKIGYACKTTGRDATETSGLNLMSTKLTYLQKLSETERRQKIHDIVVHNMIALSRVMHKLSQLPEELRMFRMGSEVLPVFDHEAGDCFYRTYEGRTLVESQLQTIGSIARRFGIRLSFHPSQFVVLASANSDTVDRSIHHLEHVTRIVEMMGYSGWHPDGFAINIHGGGAGNTDADLRTGIGRLSTQAMNLLTLENDEFSWSLERLAGLADVVAIVPDLHHHWIKEGTYLDPYCPLVDDIIGSWRGSRPKLHLAMSRQHLFPENYPVTQLPILSDLLQSGLTKSKLRAHSDAPWNVELLEYYYLYADRFDIMYEGKDKDLGQQAIHNYFTECQNESRNTN